MKNVSEKAREWDCSVSTVKRYCASGIIPPAEKRGIRGAWQIPDNWNRPPMTRRGLCYLLDTIYQLNHGVLFGDVSWGYSEDEVKSGYSYLISSAFMSSFAVNDLENALANATVTPRGAELIDRENRENKKTRFRAHLTGRANIGLAELEGGVELVH